MITCQENIREEKKILSTEGFFRKSTFCTLTEAKPGFDGHWVMPEIFLLNGTFTMLEITAFLLNIFFNSMHWCKIANLAILNHCMVLLNQCMELKKVFNKKAVISSIVKVPFSKNIHGKTQALFIWTAESDSCMRLQIFQHPGYKFLHPWKFGAKSYFVDK